MCDRFFDALDFVRPRLAVLPSERFEEFLQKVILDFITLVENGARSTDLIDRVKVWRLSRKTIPINAEVCTEVE